MAVRMLGGKKMRHLFKEIKDAQKTHSMSVGFYPQARYPNGVHVASVAYWNEYGTDKIPARPFFTRANLRLQRSYQQIFKEAIHLGGKAALNTIGMVFIGNTLKEKIQLSITGHFGSFATNAPSTIKQKGSAKPLLDTGLMRSSVNYKLGDTDGD